jgi:serine/threonine protein kinase
MEEAATQQNTQGRMDPRRMGRNNSGLTDADISDVMCILHPCSPAAFKVVALTAELAPQNVLQNDGFRDYDDGLTRSGLEEQETFILNTSGPNRAIDLALRFSAETADPTRGFIFGRNPQVCDIVLANDAHKRVSNKHFSIFMNESGVLMLWDFSTNGTMVDEVVLKGKNSDRPARRMLETGSIVQILSPNPDEIVKFIIRIPSREGHLEEYAAKFSEYMRRKANAEAAAVAAANPDNLAKRLEMAPPKTQSGSSHRLAMVQKHYGMHWSGGDKYNVVGLIGKGAFATVYQLATKSEGKIFAAKELEKRKFIKNGVLDRKLDNEMQIMKAISHPNIVQYVEYQDVANHLYIIMEFVPCGDLQQYLGAYGPLTEDIGKKVAAQVLDSLSYLHTKKITHRDIKPDNILLADLDPDSFKTKLSDFGLSKVVKDNDTFLKTFCGTLLYCAPEVFPHYDAHISGRGQKRQRKGTAMQPAKFHSYSQSVDIWSFGAVLWYSLCLKPPFEGVADNTGRGMFEKIMMTPLDPTDLVKQGVSDDAIALLAEMLNTDPASRPSPTYCLRHSWFGMQRHAVAGAASPEQGLRAIEEEEEGDAPPGDPDVAGLSLDEREDGGDSRGSQVDEASIHSGSMNFFDPRKSKRLKSDAFAYREQAEESSGELFHQSIPIVNQAGPTSPQTTPAVQRKLFGEISQSALNASHSGMRQLVSQRIHSDDAEEGANSRGRITLETSADGQGAVGSPSLQGAESMMRDVHMRDTSHSSGSIGAPAEPTTPQTPDEAQIVSSGPTGAAVGIGADETPKPGQRSTFNRQIRIPIPASFYYDANDPSTHNIEYASRVSGHDFAKNPSYLAPEGVVSLSTTISPPGTDTEEDHPDGDSDGDLDKPPAPLSQQPQLASPFVKPPPRLGKLVTSPNSFTQITIPITERKTSWGRLPTNTHVYPDGSDTRIPKLAFMLWFDSESFSSLPDESSPGTWSRLPNLYCAITTGSKSGIWINGVHLRAGDAIRQPYGRLYSGDEIQILPEGKGNKAGLKFVCEFYQGHAKERRPEGEKFKVQVISAPKPKDKGKAREKENTTAGAEVAEV